MSQELTHGLAELCWAAGSGLCTGTRSRTLAVGVLIPDASQDWFVQRGKMPPAAQGGWTCWGQGEALAWGMLLGVLALTSIRWSVAWLDSAPALGAVP